MNILTNLGADLDGLSPAARNMLDGMTKVAGLPELRTRSGYRDPARNAAAGGAKRSQHTHGNAIDLDISGYSDEQKRTILQAAVANGARGIGIYPSGNSLHIDSRSTPAFWGWNPAGAYKGADLNGAPTWAKDILTGVMGDTSVERQPLPSFAEASAQADAKANRQLPSYWNAVEQHAASAGVDSDVLWRIGGAESGFRNVPTAGRTSSAFGPFQITQGTWDGLVKNRPNLGLTNRMDPAQQAIAAPYLLAEKTADLRRRVGRDVTQGEQYLAWFLGSRDAAKVLNAPSGANPKSIVDPQSVAANASVLAGAATVDDLRAWADGKMKGTGVDGAPAPAPVDMSFKDEFKDARLSILDATPVNPYDPRERLAIEKALAGDAYSLGSGLYHAVANEATGQLFGWAGQQQVSDPSWNLTTDILKQRAADIPPQFMDYLGGSLSEADFTNRLDRLRSDMEVQRKLAGMGGLGVGVQLAAAVVDPAGWLATLAAAPIGAGVKVGRVGAVLRGAAEGATANLLVEGAVSQIKPTWETDQLIYAGAGGLIFGSVFGAVGRSKGDLAKDTTALQTSSDQLMKHLDAAYGGSSAGAAQNTVARAPVRTDTDAFLTKNFGEAYGGAAMAKFRFDITGRLKSSENPLVRALGHVFSEETVGNADGSATFRAVTEDQVKLLKQNEATWYRDLNTNWTAYAKRNGLNPIKDAHTGGLADFNRMVMDAARNTDPTRKFDAEVAAQATTFKNIMARYLKLAQGDRMEFDGTMRPGLPGFRDVTPNDNYVPRLIHWGNFRALHADVGTDGLERLVKGAVRGANPDLTDAVASKIAKGYIKRLSSVEAGQEMSSSRVFSSTDLDELRGNLETAGLAPDEIEGVLRPVVRKDGEKTGTPRGKRRQLLNENYSMQLRTASGEMREVKLVDLFENDMDRVFQSYNRNMSGQIALAGLRVRNPNFRPGEGAAQGVPASPPPVAEGYVRFYHGHDPGGDPSGGGSRWVTTDPEYARKFRAGNSEKEVSFVDIPKGDPAEVRMRNWTLEDEADGINNVGSYRHGEVPEEWAAQMKPYRADSRAVEVDDMQPEWLIDGIHNRPEWDKLLKQVRDVAASDRTSQKATDSVEADIARLQFLYDGIAGNVSKFDASSAARGLRLVRDYIFTRVMGQVGFAQLAEIGMITSGVGLKAAYKSMPALKQFLKDARTGRLADEDARQLEWISTGGTDWVRGMSHIVSDEFGTPVNVGGRQSGLDKVEGAMSRMTRLQAGASGMAPINTYLQRWASKAALYKFLDMSEEGARVNRRRMRVLGLSDEMQDRIFANIRKHKGEMSGEREGSTIGRLNLERWDPEVRAAFEHSIFRWTRKMVQENDIGQTNTILGHTIGKLIFQFRGFMFGAWTKNTLHNIHMRDWQSLSSVISSMTFGALAYTAQTHLQGLGRADREEFLQDRLSMGSLTAASFQRAGFASMFPAAVDNAGYLLGFDPVFNFRVSQTPSAGFASFPAMSLVDDTMNAVRGLTSAAQGEDYGRPEARALWSLMPFQNTLPMLWLFNHTAGRLPDGDQN